MVSFRSDIATNRAGFGIVGEKLGRQCALAVAESVSIRLGRTHGGFSKDRIDKKW